MVYRDDLGAAYARIAALEAQLRSLGDPGGDGASAELVHLRAENEQLRQEVQRVRAEHDRLRELVTDTTATQAELGRVRAERDRLVARVQVLQRSRDAAAQPGPAPAPAPPRPAPVAPPKRQPTLWEHNRALPALRGGEPAGMACPMCRAAGQDVELVRKLGRFVKVRADDLYDSVACPRCMFVALARNG
ncbi:MAG: hypothetical protein IPL61_23940 [Myxococcales bacterium]|nr:hypothetical protein [Myxococcales bacterium]